MPRRVIQTSRIPRIPTIKSSDRDLARLLNMMGGAINSLAMARSHVGGGARGEGGLYNHPFKIIGTLDGDGDPQVAIAFGQIAMWFMILDESGTMANIMPAFQDFLINADGGYPYGNPQGYTPIGQIALDADTDYGIWLRGTKTWGVAVNMDTGYDYGYSELWCRGASDWQVFADKTDVTQTSKQDEDSFTWYYIGNVKYSSSSWTVNQYLRSDLQIPFGTFPIIEVSTDSDNVLTMSANDGKIYYSDA